MFFSIDDDLGDTIVGWLLPNNPANTPSIVVHLDAAHRVIVDAFVHRPEMKSAGLHNTGLCGFVLNELNCPGIGGAGELEIRDGEDNVLIYRRRRGVDLVNGKFLRLETQLFRSSSLDEEFFNRFHMSYKALELLPEETTRQIVTLPFTNSIFASGRILWREWEPALRYWGFKIGILLRNPFEEMAERLLILKWASTPEAASTANALIPVLQTCAGAVRNINLADVAALEALLSSPSDELRALLYNPLVNQLAAPNGFDPPPSPAAAAALDSLAAIDAVGLRDDPDSFLTLVGALLDLPQTFSSVSLSASRAVIGFADVLRSMPAANALIDQDLQVYTEARRVLAPAPAEMA